MNRTYHSINRGSLEIASTVPLKRFNIYLYCVLQVLILMVETMNIIIHVCISQHQLENQSFAGTGVQLRGGAVVRDFFSYWQDVDVDVVVILSGHELNLYIGIHIDSLNFIFIYNEIKHFTNQSSQRKSGNQSKLITLPS